MCDFELPTTDEVIIVPPSVDSACVALLKEGVPMRVVVLWKVFGGSEMHLYDEHSRPILDNATLAKSKRVYYTNQTRGFNDPLTGVIIYDAMVHLRILSLQWRGVISVDGKAIVDENCMWKLSKTSGAVDRADPQMVFLA